ncbi:DUF4083 domain-containing protein [Halalkalibacter okhensis]|uniref:Uncharacterized protein n=1 Tax=Halalkalibacter okhensis TaxID=333138 RepID=A0A0B0IHZ6_9BACI|nr:DUF4083 domain-containing protein [Halalkalibacter okhensis]KHF39281.1 hypothetical protein LQ50_16400 [Halalkalibacter okhensis]
MDVTWGSILYQLVSFGLIALMIISLALFIRRLLANSTEKHNQQKELGKKLDRIIEIMEKDKR